MNIATCDRKSDREVVEAAQIIAGELRQLGTAGATTPYGAIEALSMAVLAVGRQLIAALDDVACALDGGRDPRLADIPLGGVTMSPPWLWVDAVYETSDGQIERQRVIGFDSVGEPVIVDYVDLRRARFAAGDRFFRGLEASTTGGTMHTVPAGRNRPGVL